LPWILGLSKDQGKYNYYWPYFLQLKKLLAKMLARAKVANSGSCCHGGTTTN
jgi:hypothetical protein